MKIVRESIIEGVADDAAARMFNIQKPDAEFEEKYNKKKAETKEDIIATVKGTGYNKSTYIIKNPKDTSNVGEWARGVIDEEGNLYIESKSMTIHGGIIEALIEKNILEQPKVDWWVNDPMKVGFITVQKNDKNDIYIGESNEYFEKYKESFKKFMLKAKQINPNFNFVLEIITSDN